jgi:phosphoheptose isomerase
MNDNALALSVVPHPSTEPDTALYARSVIQARVRESISVKRGLLADHLVDALSLLAGRVADSIRSGGKVIVFGYDLTFARQLKAFGCLGDVALALSTSGSSPNVLNAMEVARERGMFTSAFTGAEGGALAGLADLALVIPSNSTARIQEGYLLYAHIMCELVELELFG